MKLPLLPSTCLLALLLPAAASAQPLVYEGFDYNYITVAEVTVVPGVIQLPPTNTTTGEVFGAPLGGAGTATFSVETGPNAGTYARSNGGTGWTDSWGATNFAASGRRSATGLTWPGLPTVGIAAEDRNTASTDSQGQLRRSFSNLNPNDGTLLSDPGDVVWSSYLFQTFNTAITGISNNATRGMGALKLFSNSVTNTVNTGFGVHHRVIDPDGAGPGLPTGQLLLITGALTTSADFPSGGINLASGALTYASGEGQTHFVVMRTTFGALGAQEGNAGQGAGIRQELTVDLWFDPDLSIGIDAGSPLLSVTGASSGIGNWMTIQTDSSGGATWRGRSDEIRIGLTAADVGVPIAVPEPRAAALGLGLIALFFARFLRRR